MLKKNNIYKDFYKSFKKHPDKTAVVYQNKEISYMNLYEKIEKVLVVVKKKKITNVLIRLGNNINFIVCIYSLSKNNCGIFLSSIENNLNEDIEFIFKNKIPFLIVTKSEALVLKRKRKKFIKKIETFEKNFNLFLVYFKFISKKKLGKFVLFSSGTTGSSKAIVLSHNSLLHVTNVFNQKIKILENVKELIFLPISKSFAFMRLRWVFSIGGTVYLESSSVRSDILLAKIKEHQINSIGFTAGYYLILFYFFKKYLKKNLSNLKFIEIGSDILSVKAKSFLINNFKNTTIIYHYGLTEASRSTVQFLNCKKNINSCGRLFASSDVKIIKEKLIHKSGEICLKGKNLFDGYYVNRKIVKFKGFFKTGDYGYLKGQELYYSARKDNILNYGGKKISGLEIEEKLKKLNIFENIKILQVKDKNEIFGKSIVAFFKLNKYSKKSDYLDLSSKVLNKQTVNMIKFYNIKKFPVTSSGKIKLNKLLQLYKK